MQRLRGVEGDLQLAPGIEGATWKTMPKERRDEIANVLDQMVSRYLEGGDDDDGHDARGRQEVDGEWQLPGAGCTRSEKIDARHLDRLAVVYIRQSSMTQVQRNQESTKLQYGLTSLARHWTVDPREEWYEREQGADDRAEREQLIIHASLRSDEGPPRRFAPIGARVDRNAWSGTAGPSARVERNTHKSCTSPNPERSCGGRDE